MIKVLFFAQYKDALGQGSITIEPEENMRIADLITILKHRGESWQQVFTDPNMLIAVNHEQSNTSCRIGSGDEVAFYPPVSGG